MDTEYQQRSAHLSSQVVDGMLESLAESVEGHEGESENDYELSELQDTLCSINLSPELQLLDWTKELDLSQCPPSYKENATRENHLLTISDNFRCQYTNIYPDRKPLLLCPLNECGVMKFVSTTLQPTLLPYSELYGWKGCASFVADCLSLEPLKSSIDLPTYLFSPTWVLRSRRGTCLDFSTLLCSLLLGAGYNAYCVNGYAVKEMCLLNQSMQDCPILVTEITDTISDMKPPKEEKGYSVRPPRELRSSFERRQEQKKQEEVHAAMLEEQHEARRLQEESERPPPDNLLGLRVHCWVLVLAGSRDVPDNFFIDPLTGKSYSTADEHFLGIESIWNQHNYWVNMQDCRYGCKNMVYNLGDTVLWESMLYGSATQMLMLNTKTEPEVAGIDDDEDEAEEPKVFEMPQSWVSTITISKPDMETRYPGGRKVTQYRKAKLERFAPHLLPDGLVTRLTTYKDLECTQTSVMKEWFQNRHDHLEERELRQTDNVTLERFRPGHSFCLKSHRYVTMTPETEREMEFCGRVRADGLVRRAEQSGEMTETFEDRDDFLYHRHVVFGRRVTIIEPGETLSHGNRPIQKVIERFHRNRCRPASEDVAERVFLVAGERIEVTYHLEDERIIPAWRNFIKLPEAADTKSAHTFTPSMVTSYQVEPFEKPPKNLYLFEMLVALMKEEEKVIVGIKGSEEEVRTILSSRQQEERGIELHISIYDTARNAKVRLHRENMEPLAAEERERQKEKELDILAPLLAQLGDPETLRRQTAVQLRLDCLASLKQRLIQNANFIQARFEKETQELQLKQQWYQQNQLTMTKEDEDHYLKYCSEAMFRIHVFKLRLSRHKDTAPQKYLALDEKLRRDPRLAPHLL